MAEKKSKETLIKAVADAKKALCQAEIELQEWENSAENNRYESLTEANNAMQLKLWSKVEEGCAKRWQHGDPQYSQEFIVGNAHYIATLDVTYEITDDDDYYYVDGGEYSFEALPF